MQLSSQLACCYSSSLKCGLLWKHRRLWRAVFCLEIKRLQATLLSGLVTQHGLENIFPATRYWRMDRWLTWHGLELKLVNDIITGPSRITRPKQERYRMILYGSTYVCEIWSILLYSRILWRLKKKKTNPNQRCLTCQVCLLSKCSLNQS